MISLKRRSIEISLKRTSIEISLKSRSIVISLKSRRTVIDHLEVLDTLVGAIEVDVETQVHLVAPQRELSRYSIHV